ncbi:hypothetical protein QTI66_23460 [Variovorax sp. J22R133]|uniref:hypothetical protein n=1 Tax=Variovorax brevis TaxID=3053503 RepID=UPI0025754930|nr:hypothetical protein [Variovorax sp. J22R133]MDM0115127.1 hypothetical protein [Variovorax sp. J22R133]
MTKRQHPTVTLLQQRLEEAQVNGDAEAASEIRAQLARIEIRELSPKQLAAQAQHIASQCE